MVHNVIVETPDRNVIRLVLDGNDISDKVYSADIKLRAGKVPLLILECNLERLEMNNIELDIEGLEDDHN